MSNVTITHKLYDQNVALWTKCEDVCNGQDAVKDKTTTYLALPDPTDFSQEAALRYKNYLQRAIFYGYSRRTLQSMIGLAFRKNPKLEVPKILDYINWDIDGSSLSIYQQSQKVLSEVLKKGRTILYVDYPTVDPDSVSLADLENGYIRPVVIQLNAESVTYWRTTRIGATHKLSLVCIKETAEEGEGFEVKDVLQYRVLRFNGIVYTVEIHRDTDKGWVLYQEPQVILAGNGEPFSEIPLIFVGSTNNSPDVDYPPMLDIVNLNIGHYESSASYESSVSNCGQVQPVITGLSEQWRDHIQKTGIKIGSGGVLSLPVGSEFLLVQAKEMTIAFEAMKHQKEEIIALGGKLLEKGGAVKTATQASNENEAEHSVLSLCVSNVNEAYLMCLDWMLRFLNMTATVEYAINTDFEDNSFTPEKANAIIGLYTANLLPKSDAFSSLRRYGAISAEKTDEDIKQELEDNPEGLE